MVPSDARVAFICVDDVYQCDVRFDDDVRFEVPTRVGSNICHFGSGHERERWYADSVDLLYGFPPVGMALWHLGAGGKVDLPLACPVAAVDMAGVGVNAWML